MSRYSGVFLKLILVYKFKRNFSLHLKVSYVNYKYKYEYLEIANYIYRDKLYVSQKNLG